MGQVLSLGGFEPVWYCGGAFVEKVCSKCLCRARLLGEVSSSTSVVFSLLVSKIADIIGQQNTLGCQPRG